MTQQVRAVLVGCGGMSSAWLDAAAKVPDVSVVALVDINEEAARKQRQKFGLGQAVVGTDLKSVLTQTKPDAVFDCTVPAAHVTVTLEALHHGCHVLGEKPLADSMENARQMVAAAKQAGKIYAVIQNRRYDAPVRRMKHFLSLGEIGPITTINSDFYLGPHFGGFRDQMQHPLVLDMAIHTFDAARFLTNADPVAVYSKEWNPAGSWYAHGASAIATFEMTNGIIYSYRGSWCAEGLSTRWEADWRVVGTKGSARWDGGEGFQAEMVAKMDGFTSQQRKLDWPSHDPGDKVGGHWGLMKEFVNGVQTGKFPETVCTDNIKSLAMVFGAIESAETGKCVEIKL